MDISVAMNQAFATVKTVWDKQTKPRRYLAIIAIAFPATIILRQLYWYFYRKYHSLPPGPNGLPILGAFSSWSSDTTSRINIGINYGPIAFMPSLGMKMIIISSSKLVKQILPRKEFLNRANLIDPDKDYYHSIGSVGKSNAMGFTLANGAVWRKRRKLTADTLVKVLNNKNAGSLLKEAFDEELKPYLDEIAKSNKAWYPREIWQYITYNTIFLTLFGYKLARNSELYKKMMKEFTDTFEWGLIDLLVIKVPFMKYFFADKLDKIRNDRAETSLKLIMERVNKTNKTEKCTIDYTHEMVKNGELTQDEEIADMGLLFAAGYDTTAATLEIGTTLLAKYPEIQDKVRKELMDVMGKEYNLKMVHKCPLFRAAVHEILRISSTTFLGVNHTCFTDYWITLDDGTKYKIPKNSFINTNVDYIQIYGGKDEHWKRTNGDEIVLENFLTKDEDGGIRFVVNESFIAFGVGKRDCVGRQLAMKEVQYALGYLLLNYKVTLMNNKDGDKDLTLLRNNNLVTVELDPMIPIHVKSISQ